MTMMTKPGDGLKPGEFEAIRDAVMETSRGRWFLTEYANRLRAVETTTVLDSMKRLESAVASNHDALMRRLAEALANETPRSSPAAAQPDLAPRHMQFFKQDEDIFEPAPHAQIAAVAPPPKPEISKPEVPRGAKLVIHRTSEAAANVEAVPASEAAAPTPALAAEIPPPKAPTVDAPQTETTNAESQTSEPGKRRIVIIRHKPGEDIDVPLQSDMAEAS